MIINANFITQKKVNGPISPRQGAIVRRASGDEKRQHEELVMAKVEARKCRADLESALRAVETANSALKAYEDDLKAAKAEIDRLNREMAKLKGASQPVSRKKGPKAKKEETPADIADVACAT